MEPILGRHSPACDFAIVGWGRPFILSETDAARRSGFPQFRKYTKDDNLCQLLFL